MAIIGVPPLTPEELEESELVQSEMIAEEMQDWRITDFTGLVKSGLPERLAALLADVMPDSETTQLAELQIRREGRRVSVELVAMLPEGK